MPLTYTRENGTPEFRALKATDQNGRVVIVHVSHDAIQDYGIGACKQAGSDKYDRGEVVAGTNPQIVKIYTDDMKARR